MDESLRRVATTSTPALTVTGADSFCGGQNTCLSVENAEAGMDAFASTVFAVFRSSTVMLPDPLILLAATVTSVTVIA